MAENYEQLNPDELAALERSCRVADKIPEWLVPFDFPKDSVTQMMRLGAGQQK